AILCAYRKDGRRAGKFRLVCFPQIHSIESVQSADLVLIHINYIIEKKFEAFPKFIFETANFSLEIEPH
ncbi:MAG: hypothetical protein M3388_18745, partial [Acidobacteriota bacterium]|nr:hypothetical protein [Acidobacteriota bacterium]